MEQKSLWRVLFRSKAAFVRAWVGELQTVQKKHRKMIC